MRALNEKGRAIKGAQIALLGLAYKPDIDDVRESPSFALMNYLKEYGADVSAYDPLVPAYSTAATVSEALSGAEAAVVATAHEEFKSMTLEHFLEQGVSVVVDGRNCLPKERFLAAGILYKGIGR